MRYKMAILSALALVFTALPAFATTTVWDFASATGLLAAFHVYVSNGIPVTADGFNVLDLPTPLFGNLRGADENGLGLADDPTGLDEIGLGAGFVQLNISAVLAKGLVDGQLKIESVQPGESFDIWGSNTAGTLGTLLIKDGTLDNAFFKLPDFGKFNFYSVSATHMNVIIDSLAASSTPEPGTLALFGVGLAMIAVPLIKRHNAAASSS